LALPDVSLGDLASSPRRVEFDFVPDSSLETVRGPAGTIIGVIERAQMRLGGGADLAAALVADGLYQVTVQVENRTHLETPGDNRERALLHSLVSTHAILGITGGEFVSLLDPPEPWRGLAAGCLNIGTFPVLVGANGQTDTMLSSPIILYDYPQVAPESPGDLFDATEIDEILTLRIMTLTDDEKRSIAALDERGRALLERTEALAREQLMGLHGTMRAVHPVAGTGSHEHE
jgi:hydrogenase maturation protease